jgi:hypothetical protein
VVCSAGVRVAFPCGLSVQVAGWFITRAFTLAPVSCQVGHGSPRRPAPGLADLEQAASRERQLARQRLHQKRSGEILTTCMVFPLKAAKERMGEGLAIGDSVQLVQVTINDYDANAIEVRWRGQWIGFIPRYLAALLVAEVPQLATTSERDAFRLQLSIYLDGGLPRLKRLLWGELTFQSQQASPAAAVAHRGPRQEGPSLPSALAESVVAAAGGRDGSVVVRMTLRPNPACIPQH